MNHGFEIKNTTKFPKCSKVLEPLHQLHFYPKLAFERVLNLVYLSFSSRAKESWTWWDKIAAHFLPYYIFQSKIICLSRTWLDIVSFRQENTDFNRKRVEILKELAKSHVDRQKY